MKNLLFSCFFPLAFLLALAPFFSLSAQTNTSLSDTIGYHKNKFKFSYQGEIYKRPKVLGDLLLQEPVAPEVRSAWQDYKSLHGASIGVEVVGLGVMALGLVNTTKGEGGADLLVGGAAALLGGIILDAALASPKAKKSVRLFNNRKLGRTPLPMAPPLPQVYPRDSMPAPTPRQRQTARPPASSTGRYASFAVGLGWSRQKINYEYAFEADYLRARVFSFGAALGGPLSGQWGYELGLDLTQHGYREAVTTTTSGVKVKAKSDLRLRYLEVPLLLTYRIPAGKSGLEISPAAGLSLGYAVSGKIVTRGDGEHDTRSVHIKTVDKITFKDVKSGDRLDAALLLGARVSYGCGKGSGRLFLEGRWHCGILNLERSAETAPDEEKPKAFNRSLLLRVGYQVAL